MVIHLLASPHRAVLPARFQMAPWFRECNSAFSISGSHPFWTSRLEAAETQSGGGAGGGGDCGGGIGDGLGITTSGEPGATEAGAEGLGSTVGREASQPARPASMARAGAASQGRLRRSLQLSRPDYTRLKTPPYSRKFRPLPSVTNSRYGLSGGMS